MKQPKTVEEFMALPAREMFDQERIQITSENRAELEARVGGPLLGRYICFPVMRPAMAIAYEADTVMYCDGWILGLDDEGFCRRPAPLPL
jgi:hypothetical protein